MNRVNLMVLIDQLEILVEKAPEVPLVGKILVDADELYDLIDIIRTAIPVEVKRAEAVSSEREKMIAEGQKQAERMVAKAEEYAAKLVRNNEVYRQAEEEGKRLYEETKRRAEEIEEGARQYAGQIFTNLQQALEKTLHIIEKSKEELERED
ncbi:MAG: hypothetical protein GX335_06205 [Firmicutes bacterium]|nr:hypothetical protein [Bacillota bacterium]